jgi:alkylhydroperoxidase family enzyme
LARRQGATDAQLDAIARGAYEAFEESWRAALRYADEMTPTPGIVSDATFADLASSWNPTQIIEITAVICMFNFFNRFAHALEIPVTR